MYTKLLINNYSLEFWWIIIWKSENKYSIESIKIISKALYGIYKGSVLVFDQSKKNGFLAYIRHFHHLELII